jgi:hypothetical protein
MRPPFSTRFAGKPSALFLSLPDGAIADTLQLGRGEITDKSPFEEDPPK